MIAVSDRSSTSSRGSRATSAIPASVTRVPSRCSTSSAGRRDSASRWASVVGVSERYSAVSAVFSTMSDSRAGFGSSTPRSESRRTPWVRRQYRRGLGPPRPSARARTAPRTRGPPATGMCLAAGAECPTAPRRHPPAPDRLGPRHAGDGPGSEEAVEAEVSERRRRPSAPARRASPTKGGEAWRTPGRGAGPWSTLPVRRRSVGCVKLRDSCPLLKLRVSFSKQRNLTYVQGISKARSAGSIPPRSLAKGTLQQEPHAQRILSGRLSLHPRRGTRPPAALREPRSSSSAPSGSCGPRSTSTWRGWRICTAR